MDFFRRILGQRVINIYHLAMAILANFVFGFPSRKLKVIGITGTDGKTTNVNLIAEVLKAGGHSVSFLSSINARIGDEVFDTGLHTTTPSSFLLQSLLKRIVAAGSEFAVLEVTSHALDQYRTWGIKFETAVLTNITREHLDYHKNFEGYMRAKMKLFEKAEYGIVNIEYRDLINTNKTITYGLSPKAQIWAGNIREELKSTNFTVHIPNLIFNIQLHFPGKFNVLNALAAISVAQIYEIPQSAIISGLEAVKIIPGRTEFIDEGQEFLAMVDFAHTPNALKNVLEFLRPKISGKIILVFGSAGERDTQKRPEMGKIAGKFTDLIVVTREDNRSESAEKIGKEILSGIGRKTQSHNVVVILDRREAIRFAVSKAQKNDIVVVTGKGHEQSLNIDGREVPWDDRKVMREEIKQVVSSK